VVEVEKTVTVEGTQRKERKSQKEGRGVMLFVNGDLYNGEWHDNKMHGRGTYYFNMENCIYSGEFKEGELTGRGFIFYSDSQDFYMGEVQKGRYHGKGLIYRKADDRWELNEYKDDHK